VLFDVEHNAFWATPGPATRLPSNAMGACRLVPRCLPTVSPLLTRDMFDIRPLPETAMRERDA
jgi:hypothetical protein